MEVVTTSLQAPFLSRIVRLRPSKPQNAQSCIHIYNAAGLFVQGLSRPAVAAANEGAFSVKARWPMALVLGITVLLHPAPCSSDALALTLDWFGNSSSTIQKDPVEPFTLYGSVFKKYFIENIVEGKVISRKKGFTTTACVNALDADKETPELQGVPAGLKVVIIGEPVCSKIEGQSREETCLPACKIACTRAIARHLADVTKETGYVLDSKDNTKVVVSCSSQCTNECLKPGKTSSFIYSFRPSK